MEPSKHLHQAFAALCRRDPDISEYFWLGVQVVSAHNQNGRWRSTKDEYVKVWNSSSVFFRCVPVKTDHDCFRLEDRAMTHLQQSLLSLTNTAFQGIHFCMLGEKTATAIVSRLKMGLPALKVQVELCPNGEYIPANIIAALTDRGILKSWISEYLRRPGSLYSLIEEQ